MASSPTPLFVHSAPLPTRARRATTSRLNPPQPTSRYKASVAPYTLFSRSGSAGRPRLDRDRLDIWAAFCRFESLPMIGKHKTGRGREVKAHTLDEANL